MSQPREKLKHFIEQEVFVTQKKERILPENAKWLMDFRRVCLDPEFLDAYTEDFFERFKDLYPFQVGGMEVAAIPLVSAIIMKMREKGKPVNGFFIRKSRKKSGLLKMIEGKLTHDPVILVDDLINHGYTLDRQLKVLEEAGKRVVAYFVLLHFRSREAYAKYEKENIRLEAIFSLEDFRSTLGTRLLPPDESLPREVFHVKWYFSAQDPKLEFVIPKSGLVLDAEKVYFGSDRGTFFALDQENGRVVWKEQIGLWAKGPEIFSTPVIGKERIYFGAYDGNIYCLDIKTGKRQWVSFEADWIHGSPVLSDSKEILYAPVVFGLGGQEGGLIALDAITGKKIWHTSFVGAAFASPLLVEEEETIFIGSEDGTFLALEQKTGKKKWSFRSRGAVKDVPVYDAQNRRIIFSSFDGSVYALSVENGLLNWRNDKGIAHYSGPILWQGKIYFNSLDKHLYCVDAQSGTDLWNIPARARIFSRPRIWKNKLYFGANDARLYEIDPETGKQTGYFQAVERITDQLQYSSQKDLFYLKTYANEVYCLERIAT